LHRNIKEDLAGGKDVFMTNRSIRDAVMHDLRVLAESSKRTSAETKARHNDVPWRDLADFRNVVVHDYLRIDFEEIWTIVENNLPPLEAQLSRIAATLRPHS
jgi:uncharacterized protein with HEPN domain